MAVVKVDCKNLKNNPQCPHGPTLKFVKMCDGRKQGFYACSTYRDRKDCGFYLPEGVKLTDEVRRMWESERGRSLPSVDHEKSEERLREVRRALPQHRLYCHTCAELDLVLRRNNHSSHIVQSVVSDEMLSHPSKILKPKEGNKREAQYLFASDSIKVIVENLRREAVTNVLCIGTPRVHEHLQSLENSEMDSLLLDTDHRYHSFWPRDKFVWFNVFNRHFYSGAAEPRRVVREFLSGHQGALIIDPPFGGHVDPLAATIRHFCKLYARLNPQKELKVVWVFPYFRERHITERLPGVAMLDYKVEYDNHSGYSSKRKLGSPARLFTNIGPSQFVLPETEGYRFCRLCSKWVSRENEHCKKCNMCTSKDGRTYKHCDRCGKCVKPRWQHCSTCRDCLPAEHVCHNQDQVSPDENTEPRHKRMKRIQQKWKDKKNKKKRKTL